MNPDRLHYARLSPFARRAIVAALELDLSHGIVLIDADIWHPDNPAIDDNPAGKVPVMVTEAGSITGSLHVCLYLEQLAGRAQLFPDDPASRKEALVTSGLAEAIMEAAVAHVTERIRRPQATIWPDWLARQEAKIIRLLKSLEARTPPVGTDIAAVTLGCALAYLDIRLPDLDWRQQAPGLAEWQRAFSGRRSMTATHWLLEADQVPSPLPLSKLIA